MADGFTKIPRCVPGEKSLVSAEYANRLIDLLNAIGSGSVAPIANVGSMKVAGGQFILDLTALDGRLKKIESQIFVNGTASLESRVAIIEGRLNNANIIANGSCAGNNIAINISLNI